MIKIASIFRDAVMPSAVLWLGIVVLHDHLARPRAVDPRPAVDGKALGRSYAPLLAASLAAGWIAAADALEAGRSVAESQAALQETWNEARARAFSTRIAPEFARVLAEGAEPTDPTRRAEVARLWRDFASGLEEER